MKMSQIERVRAIETQHLSTRVAVTIPLLARVFDVAENTIKSDLLFLEAQGVAVCRNPEQKPQNWYAVRTTDSLEISLELASALKHVHRVAKVLLPCALFSEVENVFQAANDTYIKKEKANHQSKVVKYDRNVSKIDFAKHYFMGGITEDVLEAIKSAMYGDKMLRIELDGYEEVLEEISLLDFGNKLILKGKHYGFGGEMQSFNVKDIQAAWMIDYRTLHQMRNRVA